MASCLSCEAELRHLDVDVGETVRCVECGAEHEVLAAIPLKLALLDDMDLDDDEDPEEADPDEEEY